MSDTDDAISAVMRLNEENANLRAGMLEMSRAHMNEMDAMKLQNRELKEELQHQKELWVVALPQLHALDDRAGIVRFGQLHDPQGSIDKTLAQKPKDVCMIGLPYGQSGVADFCALPRPCPIHEKDGERMEKRNQP